MLLDVVRHCKGRCHKKFHAFLEVKLQLPLEKKLIPLLCNTPNPLTGAHWNLLDPQRAVNDYVHCRMVARHAPVETAHHRVDALAISALS